MASYNTNKKQVFQFTSARRHQAALVMAEETLEEIEDLVEEAGEGVDEEADNDEDLTKEEKEEVEEEATEAKDNIEEIGDTIDKERMMSIPVVLRKFRNYVSQLAAIAAVFQEVVVLLKVLKDDSSKQEIDSRMKKVQALIALVNDLTSTSNTLFKGLEETNVNIKVKDGMEIPLPDIFTKYMTPIENALQSAFSIAKQLISKDASGKTTFSVPTADQVNEILSGCAGFINSLQQFTDFAKAKSEEYPQLKKLPVSKKKVEKLKENLDNVKTMPFGQ